MILGRNAPLIAVVSAGILILGLGAWALLQTPVAAGGGIHADRTGAGATDASRSSSSREPEAAGGEASREASLPKAARKAVTDATSTAAHAPAASDSRNPASLYGVVHHQRAAVPDATVELSRLPGRDELRRMWRRRGEASSSSSRLEPHAVADTQTDDAGAFLLDEVPPGDRYVLAIEAEGFARVSLAGVVLVEGEDADAGVIDLVREARVSGIVREERGAPLDEVEVSVVAVTSGGPMSAWLPPAASATTAAGGRFDMGGLSPGRYEVVADHEGYVEARSEALELLEGESAKGLVLRLSMGLALDGRVVDPASQPVSGARVSAAATQGFFGRGSLGRASFGRFRGDTPARTVITKDDGTFRITGLREEGYAVSAHARGYGPVTFPLVVPGGEALALQLGGTAVIRGVLRDQTRGMPIELPPGMRIADVVSLRPAAGGAWWSRIAGAEKEDLPVAVAEDRGPGAIATAAATPSDGDAPATAPVPATFRFDGVPPGTWIVRARMQGFVEAESEELTLREGEVHEVRIALDPGVSLEGIAVIEGTNDPVVGAGITATRVPEPEEEALRGRGGRSRGTSGRGRPGWGGFGRGGEDEVARAESAEDGTFRLEHLPRGVIEVMGRNEGQLASAPLDVDLSGGSAPGTIVLSFRLPATLEGNVTTWEGLPAGGVHVTARRTDDGDVSRTFTRSDGTYSFAALAPGSYRVEAEVRPAETSPDLSSLFFRRLRERFRPARGGSDDRGVLVDLSSGDRLRADLILPPPTTVAGRVTESGAAVAGLRLTLDDAAAPEAAAPGGGSRPRRFVPPAGFATTGVLGDFLFEDVPPGIYRITARPPGSPATSSDSIEVAAGEQARVDLLLPASTVEVRVLDETRGKPIARAEVQLEEVQTGAQTTPSGARGASDSRGGSGAQGASGVQGTSGSPAASRRASRIAREIRRRFGQRTVRAGDDGRASIRHVPPGTYIVTASADGYGEGASEELVLDEDGGVREIELRLIPGGWITGVARDFAGIPLARVRITAQDVTGGAASGGTSAAAASTRTAPDGSFVLDGLTPGPWMVRATDRGTTVETPVTIRTGKASEVELILPRPSTGS